MDNFYQLSHTILSNQPDRNSSKYLFNENSALEQFPLSNSPSTTHPKYLHLDRRSWAPCTLLRSSHQPYFAAWFYSEERFTQRLYLVEWRRRWWLQAPRGCRTIPRTQGLREWPNSRRYCSLNLVSTGPIQPSFRQDGTCPGCSPGEERSYRDSYETTCQVVPISWNGPTRVNLLIGLLGLPQLEVCYYLLLSVSHLYRRSGYRRKVTSGISATASRHNW